MYIVLILDVYNGETTIDGVRTVATIEEARALYDSFTRQSVHYDVMIFDASRTDEESNCVRV